MIGYIRRQKDDNNKISHPPGFESQNHIAIKKPPQGRFFYGVSGGTSRLFSNFADSAAACRLNKQTAPLTTKSDIQSLFYRFAPSRVRVPKSYCHKKTAARTVFFMASAAGLEPTAPGLGNLCSILMSYADLIQERIITALFTKSIILRHLSTISDWPPRF